MINEKFKERILTEWNNYRDIGTDPLMYRVFNAYRFSNMHATHFVGFEDWIEQCTYEDLEREFTEHEVMEIAMYGSVKPKS